MMSTSFAFLFDDKKDLDSLIIASQNSFNTNYCRKSQDCTVLMNGDDTYIIKLFRHKLKFIINDDKEEDIDKKIEQVKEFINHYFLNETVGFKYYGGEYNVDLTKFENFKDTEIINLQ